MSDGADGPGLVFEPHQIEATGLFSSEAAPFVAALLAGLAAAAGSRARLGVLHPAGVRCLEMSFGDGPSTMTTGELPAHRSALGQVLLANAQEPVDSRIEGELVGSTQVTHTSLDEVNLALAVTRLSGVAMIHTGPRSPAVEVAVPVLNPDGDVVAALDVVADDLGHADAVILGALRRAAAAVTGLLADPAH